MEATTCLLTDVLFWNILIRLPVKSLKRFQCVSKSWNALIKDPNFVAQHLQFHNINYPNHCFIASMYDRGAQGLRFLNFNINYPNQRSIHIDPFDWPELSACLPNFCQPTGNIRGPSNGIYCFYDSSHTVTDSIVLVNVSLREFKVVPEPEESIFSNLRGYSRQDYYIEFGFDKKANDYKVVLIWKILGFSFEAAVYSLRSNSWKKVNDVYHILQDTASFDDHHWDRNRMNTFVNGNFHWCAEDGDGEEFILSFDIAGEPFGKVKLIPSLCLKNRNVYGDKNKLFQRVAALNGSLSLFLLPMTGVWNIRNHDKCIIEVWVMQEYGKEESWTKKYTIKPARLAIPMGFFPDGRIFFNQFPYYEPFQSPYLVSYDPASDKISEVDFWALDYYYPGDDDDDDDDDDSDDDDNSDNSDTDYPFSRYGRPVLYCFCSYEESLVSVKGHKKSDLNPAAKPFFPSTLTALKETATPHAYGAPSAAVVVQQQVPFHGMTSSQFPQQPTDHGQLVSLPVNNVGFVNPYQYPNSQFGPYSNYYHSQEVVGYMGNWGPRPGYYLLQVGPPAYSGFYQRYY